MQVFIDFETLGLRGQAFAGTMLAPDGTILFRGWYDSPELAADSWLQANVVPHVGGTKYANDREFFAAFASAWKTAKDLYGVFGFGGKTLAAVAHMGSPVESGMFAELYRRGLIGEFDGPYPLMDTAPLLFAAGYAPDSEVKFAQARGILPAGHNSHCDLDDCRLTRLVWQQLTEVCLPAPVVRATQRWTPPEQPDGVCPEGYMPNGNGSFKPVSEYYTD